MAAIIPLSPAGAFGVLPYLIYHRLTPWSHGGTQAGDRSSSGDSARRRAAGFAGRPRSSLGAPIAPGTATSATSRGDDDVRSAAHPSRAVLSFSRSSQQIDHGDAASLRELLERSYRRIVVSCLEQPDVLARDAGSFRQFGSAHVLLLAQLLKSSTHLLGCWAHVRLWQVYLSRSRRLSRVLPRHMNRVSHR